MKHQWPFLILSLCLAAGISLSMLHRAKEENRKLKRQIETYKRVVKQQSLNNAMWRKAYYGKNN